MSLVDSTDKIAVCSRSFSKNETLKTELQQKFKNVIFNSAGKEFTALELIDFLKGADRAIIGLEKINEEILAQLPQLKVIAKYGVGLDSIDIPAIKKFNIKLGWTAGVNKRSVAELALGHMIACLRHLYELNQTVKAGFWTNKQGTQLSGKSIGIVGLGNVGQDLVQLLKAFDCKFLANDIEDRSGFAEKNSVSLVSKEELFSESDIVTLHIPLSTENKNVIGEKYLNLMKSNAILINTARGHLVDEAVLYQLLSTNKISAAAFDVLGEEPPQNNRLLQLSNFFISPHIGGSTVESVLAMGRAAIAGLEQADYL